LNKLHFNLLHLLSSDFATVWGNLIQNIHREALSIRPSVCWSVYWFVFLFSILTQFVQTLAQYGWAKPNHRVHVVPHNHLANFTNTSRLRKCASDDMFGYIWLLFTYCAMRQEIENTSGRTYRCCKSWVNNTFLCIPDLHLLTSKGPTACTTGKVSVNIIVFNILACRELFVSRFLSDWISMRKSNSITFHPVQTPPTWVTWARWLNLLSVAITPSVYDVDLTEISRDSL
jgi:hypothetical protein